MTLAAFIDRSRQDIEDWRYTNLDKLLPLSLSPAGRVREGGAALAPRDPSPFSRKEEQSPRLTFLNGVFQPKDSTFGTVPSCILMGDAESGYTVTLGEHTCLVAQPLELLFASDATAGDEINIRLSIVLGPNARLTLLENHAASHAPTTVQSDVTLAPSAKLVHVKAVTAGPHLAAQTVRVAEGAYYQGFSMLCGGAVVRHETDIHLDGPQAQAALNAVMLGRDHDHLDTTTRLWHHAPNAASRQICKTVLADAARGVFQGKIAVAPQAQKTDGYQLSRALLLSDRAEMDAKPELEIFADDVKCSHGSTIGDLDDDALFYLRSRGLSEPQARALLIEAFIGETLDDIPVDAWRESLRHLAQGWCA